jgi:hypothetical protein
MPPQERNYKFRSAFVSGYARFLFSACCHQAELILPGECRRHDSMLDAIRPPHFFRAKVGLHKNEDKISRGYFLGVPIF